MGLGSRWFIRLSAPNAFNNTGMVSHFDSIAVEEAKWTEREFEETEVLEVLISQQGSRSRWVLFSRFSDLLGGSWLDECLWGDLQAREV